MEEFLNKLNTTNIYPETIPNGINPAPNNKLNVNADSSLCQNSNENLQYQASVCSSEDYKTYNKNRKEKNKDAVNTFFNGVCSSQCYPGFHE